MSVQVAGLFVYPVKSCAGLARPSVKFGERGPIGDREWMIVDAGGRFLTQRERPELALIRVAFGQERLTLRTPAGECRVPLRAKPGLKIDIQVWKHLGPALDAGEGAAALLSEFLKIPARLVRLAPEHERRSKSGSELSFVDTAPVLVVSEASLELLNRKMGTPLPMDRFRPSIVLHGGEAHQEDGWTGIRIGSVELRRMEDCTRCAITTVDQKSGVRLGPEPLKTLATYRRNEKNEVRFGAYYDVTISGAIKLGDKVSPL